MENKDYMKFKIEMDLKNFETALLRIANCGEQYFDEALTLIKKQRLFKQGLECYKDHPSLVIQIKRAFGYYLHQRGYVQEAGFLYMGTGESEDLQSALEAFKKCVNIDMCFSLAYRLQFGPDKLEALRNDLVDILATAHRYKEAGDLIVGGPNYDISTAVDMYAKGNAFMQAIRESSKEADPTKRE
mmetsp:Transcript_26788/g.40861  ORF Transcript_26788/g.40861 Transcript_26788/m.40861 type:complete len:186 (-) Transcript_26788:697-1254(-)